MGKQSFFVWGILLMLAVVSECGVIKQKANSSGDGKDPEAIHTFDEDKSFRNPPEKSESGKGGDDVIVYYDTDEEVKDDYDYNKPGKDDSVPEVKLDENKPEIIPSNEDINWDDKKDDKGILDEEYEDKPVDKDEDGSDDEDYKKVLEDDKNESKKEEEDDDDDDDDDNKKVSEEEDDQEVSEEEDDDSKKVSEEDDDQEVSEEEEHDTKMLEDDEDDGEEKHGKKNLPKDEKDKEEHNPADKESDEKHHDKKGDGKKDLHGFFDSSIFDTPFFNLNQVQKYFSEIQKALGDVFQQTVEEALRMNGTYTNTTDEEIEIDGKKYIVRKSVLKGADNHSALYIEALTAKDKLEEINGHEIKNGTDM